MSGRHVLRTACGRWLALGILAGALAATGCDPVVEIVVQVPTRPQVTRLVISEFIADVLQDPPREIAIRSPDAGWRFGLQGAFLAAGSYQVKASFYDARGCVLQLAETARLDLASVGTRGARLELKEAPASGPRAESFCAESKAAGILTGEVSTVERRRGGFKRPADVCWDPACDTLFVSDSQNHRILGYRGLPANLPAWRDSSPTFVIGRASNTDFSDDLVKPEAASVWSLNSPQGLFCEDGVLMVADTGNHRVLVYAPPLSMSCLDGSFPPVGAIGQGDFRGGKINGSDNGSPTATTLYSPMSVFWSHRRNRLLVADQKNHRVLGFPLSTRTQLAMLFSPSAAATEVWGQSTLTSGKYGAGDTGLFLPSWVLENPDDPGSGRSQDWIAIADTGNSRVMLYDGGTQYDGSRAIQARQVLGQPDFSSTQGGAGPGQLSGPQGLRLGQGLVFLADRQNGRVMMFPQSALSGSLGQDGFLSTGVALPITVPVAGADPLAPPTPVSVALMQKDQRTILLIVDEARNAIVALDKTM